MATAAEPQAEKRDKRASTAQFKIVPESRELRDRVRAEAARFGKTFDRAKPFTKQSLRSLGEEMLKAM